MNKLEAELDAREDEGGTLVVGVAASAGGLDSIRELLGALQPDANLALIIAQHLSPNHRSVLTDLLSQASALEVLTAEDGQSITAGKVYVTPSNRDITVSQGHIRLQPPPDRVMPKPSADRLLRSLASDYPESCAAVVLSGTGSDGAAGVRAIKTAGGAAFVHEPGYATYDGMPRAALETGCADPVQTAADIAERLVWLAAGNSTAVGEISGGDAMERIVQRVYRDRRMDLSAYREATLQRRARRRLVATGCADLDVYERLLSQDSDEMDRLCRELLISVTEFFRDWEAFEALRHALKTMLGHRSKGGELRIWVPGCATGEEAYSIAMLLCDLLGDDLPLYSVHIFATDLDEEALAEARTGVYPTGAIQDLPSRVVEQYFIRDGGQVQVIKTLREMMVFARQDLLKDPPFTRIDLISCRNVLIYLRPETQHRVLDLFHHALAQSGRLFLGRAEGISGREFLYTPLYSAQRVYQRRNDVQASPLRLGDSWSRGTAPPRRKASTTQSSLAERINQATISSYAPPSVLVDAAGTLLRSDRANDYISLPNGEVTLGAQSMMSEELRSDFITLLARSHREGCEQESAPIQLSGKDTRVRLRVVPVPGKEAGERVYYLVFFEPEAHAVDPYIDLADADEAAQRTIEALRGELTATREHLHVITEELERANQELQASNEELQSSNEELQSTNEELETSNEELQSTNEELTTVNEELNRRTEELSIAHDDLRNITDSISDPILVIDEEHCVKLFNPAARKFFQLDGYRIGVPVAAIAGIPGGINLTERVTRVARDAHPEEVFIGEDEASYLLRLLPYRDHNCMVRGCILLVADQTVIRRAEKGLLEAKAEAEKANQAKNEFLSSMSHELRTPLNAILGFTQLLRSDNGLDERVRSEYLGYIINASWFLRDLVNEVLDLSRIEAGQLVVQPQAQELSGLIEQCRAFVWADAKDAGVDIELDIDSELVGYADPVRMRQILINMLSNAVKYNCQGGRVQVKVGADELGKTAHIDVLDTGQGISEEQKEKLFKPFERLGKERSTIEGSGIGLVVSRNLAELMGGQLYLLSSRTGEGSRFRLCIPLLGGQDAGADGVGVAAPIEADERDMVEAPTGKTIRVLYVEDNELNKMLVRGLLARREDIELTEVGDGAAGVKAVTNMDFDMILLDLHLPDMTGFDVFNRLQQMGLLKDTPVVAVSADALPEQQEKAASLGFWDYLVKPFRLEDLERLLADAAT